MTVQFGNGLAALGNQLAPGGAAGGTTLGTGAPGPGAALGAPAPIPGPGPMFGNAPAPTGKLSLLA